MFSLPGVGGRRRRTGREQPCGMGVVQLVAAAVTFSPGPRIVPRPGQKKRNADTARKDAGADAALHQAVRPSDRPSPLLGQRVAAPERSRA